MEYLKNYFTFFCITFDFILLQVFKELIIAMKLVPLEQALSDRSDACSACNMVTLVMSRAVWHART